MAVGGHRRLEGTRADVSRETRTGAQGFGNLSSASAGRANTCTDNTGSVTVEDVEKTDFMLLGCWVPMYKGAVPKCQKLTWEEIRKRYPDQWVSLADVDKEEDGGVRTAVVITAGPDLKIVTKKLKEGGLPSDRFEYTGTIKRFLGFAKWDIEEIEHAPPIA